MKAVAVPLIQLFFTVGSSEPVNAVGTTHNTFWFCDTMDVGILFLQVIREAAVIHDLPHLADK